ncbi:hypothetical protein B4144_0978 [Bacillus atrophaeus]|nr:hypothetical protein B4144_0978 [Bacillus atrophaeus]
MQALSSHKSFNFESRDNSGYSVNIHLIRRVPKGVVGSDKSVNI